MVTAVTREDMLAFRVRAQRLDAESSSLADAPVADIGIQDTGPDGGLWALAIRGVDVSSLGDDDLTLLWTIRGAPHLYRRADLPSVAAAVAPFSEADARKRIYDASKPLRDAGIEILTALDTVAGAMRSVVTEPTVKGEVSSQITRLLPQPYRRTCRPCDAIHLYEMTFRLSAFRAGLELRPGTSPPVLQRIPGFAPAAESTAEHDVIRAYLRLLGPATPAQVASYLDAPVKDVKARWPDDAVEVTVDGETRWLLDADMEKITAGAATTSRLLGPFDLFLQTKDRPLLVPDARRSKSLWPVLGRPGAVLVDGDIAGSWRPRASGSTLTVQVEPWVKMTTAARRAVEQQAERLAAHRRVRLSRVDFSE